MQAPWDKPENIEFERVVEESIPDVRSYLADELPQLMWELAKEAVEDNLRGGVWEDWNLDNREDLCMAVYDEMMDEAKKLWES